MAAETITALIAAFSGLSIAGLSYFFTKMRERDAELRKEKLEHYKDFVNSLNGILAGEETPEGQRAYALACNKLQLIAPQTVIEALHGFQQGTKSSNKNKSNAHHDELLSALFFEMRKDLKISPTDNIATFEVYLWASGIPPKQ